MKINVTQEHVEKAIKDRLNGQLMARCCPTAQCLKEMFPDASSIGVSLQ